MLNTLDFGALPDKLRCYVIFLYERVSRNKKRPFWSEQSFLFIWVVKKMMIECRCMVWLVSCTSIWLCWWVIWCVVGGV